MREEMKTISAEKLKRLSVGDTKVITSPVKEKQDPVQLLLKQSADSHTRLEKMIQQQIDATLAMAGQKQNVEVVLPASRKVIVMDIEVTRRDNDNMIKNVKLTGSVSYENPETSDV